MNMKTPVEAKLRVLDELEQLLGDRFGSKLPGKPEAAILEVKAEDPHSAAGDPELPDDEASESPEEEKAEDAKGMEMEPSDDDRIHEMMTRSGDMMGDDDPFSAYADKADGPEDAALMKKMMLSKKLKG
jgi:hypothetical protein